jgi:hypothetical protein
MCFAIPTPWGIFHVCIPDIPTLILILSPILTTISVIAWKIRHWQKGEDK